MKPSKMLMLFLIPSAILLSLDGSVLAQRIVASIPVGVFPEEEWPSTGSPIVSTSLIWLGNLFHRSCKLLRKLCTGRRAEVVN